MADHPLFPNTVRKPAAADIVATTQVVGQQAVCVEWSLGGEDFTPGGGPPPAPPSGGGSNEAGDGTTCVCPAGWKLMVLYDDTTSSIDIGGSSRGGTISVCAPDYSDGEDGTAAKTPGSYPC